MGNKVPIGYTMGNGEASIYALRLAVTKSCGIGSE